MGYFPNGTSGDVYEAQYCRKCIHEGGEKGCPVMLTHLLYAYQECNNDSPAKHMLDMLIPIDECRNEQCTMFVDRESIPEGEHTHVLWLNEKQTKFVQTEASDAARRHADRSRIYWNRERDELLASLNPIPIAGKK